MDPASPGPFLSSISIRPAELPLGRDAVSLAHHGESHALADVRAGSKRPAALAGALDRRSCPCNGLQRPVHWSVVNALYGVTGAPTNLTVDN